jgi:cytidylate kinase
VVLPDADLKVFITADAAVRAERRAAQDVDLGKDGVDVGQTHTALLERDDKDSTRETSPLAQAVDAVVVDTTHVTLAQVIDEVCALAEALPR